MPRTKKQIIDILSYFIRENYELIEKKKSPEKVAEDIYNNLVIYGDLEEHKK